MKADVFAREVKRMPGVSLFMLAHEVDADMRDPWMDQLSDSRTGLTNREELLRLRTDLALIEEGWVPQPGDLARYPRLENWGITGVEGEPLWRLYGCAYGCSGFASGLEIVTMQVLAVDRGFTWARDRVWIYRLGLPDGVLPS